MSEPNYFELTHSLSQKHSHPHTHPHARTHARARVHTPFLSPERSHILPQCRVPGRRGRGRGRRATGRARGRGAAAPPQIRGIRIAFSPRFGAAPSKSVARTPRSRTAARRPRAAILLACGSSGLSVGTEISRRGISMAPWLGPARAPSPPAADPEPASVCAREACWHTCGVEMHERATASSDNRMSESGHL